MQTLAARAAPASAPTRRLVDSAWFVAAALPTLVAAFTGAGLILDDIEFAATARFEGFGGFAEEIGYRPGQGQIHQLGFVGFGERALLHLMVLAALNGLVAVLMGRLASRLLPPPQAVATTAVWVLLAHRDATRFWVSTTPNQVALALVLGAALVIAGHRPSVRTTGVVVALGLAAVGTYEGALGAAGLLSCWATWDRVPSRWAARAAVALAPLAAVAGIVAWRSPRRGSTTPFAGWEDSVGHHLRSVVPAPFGPLGPMLLVLTVAVAVVAVRRDRRSAAWAAPVGAALVVAGLLPFLLGGFPIGPNGVLDRGNLFADLGIAAITGWGIAALGGMLPDGRAPRVALVVAALAFAGPAVFGDLPDYRAASDDVSDLRVELAGVERPDSGVVEIERPPNHGGVVALSYRVQVADLWRLVHDEADEPDWIRLTGSDPP